MSVIPETSHFKDSTREVPPPFPVRRFTVAKYHRLIDIGVLAEGERCELLEGWIVPMMSRNPPREVAMALALQALTSDIPAGWHIRTQSAVAGDRSEPEPDFSIVAGSPRNYLADHPTGENIALAIEIADSSLAFDRTHKARVYASAGICVCWIINIPERQIEVYRDPVSSPAPAYRSRRDYAIGAEVPLEIGGKAVAGVAVADLLP
jgi:hypothetical protein